MRGADDPTLGVTREKAKSKGYKTWSEDHIARFEAADRKRMARVAMAKLAEGGW
jgi:hypothetical protein